MNTAEEISIYRNPQDFYPTKRATLVYGYDFPEKNSKKEKKWSIGSLFRRKKKEESDSSSAEDTKKGFLNRRRRKSDGKRRKPKTLGGFDHVVMPKAPVYQQREDTGILSDPSGGFSSYAGRNTASVSSQNHPPQSQSAYNSITNLNSSTMSVGSVGSADSLTKKKAKGLVKARAAARRTALAHESSSDDDSSLRSNSSLKMRSEESLSKPVLDPSHSRKSRAARTERYLKRHSRDGENPHNYLRLSKSDVDDARSLSRSPNMPRPGHASISSSNMSGLSTIPPTHVQTKYIASNSTSNPCYKPPLSMNDYNSSQRSISCDGNIHKAPSFEDNHVLHVQLPIMRPNARNYRNLSFIEPGQVNCLRQPPQPPPRDPNRTVVSHYFENGRPNTFYLDGCVGQSKTKSFHGSGSKIVMPKASSFNFGPSWRSNSEVHIPSDPFQLQTPVRPASTTPEPKYRYITPREERHTVEGYNYLADKHPRSRKPIVIQSSAKVEPRKDSPTQKALEFWKQREENVPKPCPKPTTSSPQIFTSQAHVQSQVFLGPPQQNDSSRIASPFKPVSPTVKEVLKLLPEDSNRKSANLEEALNELEAIYNSLRLGDENLLERAEQREKETLIQKAEEAKKVTARGALSDSSFSYEPFDQVGSPKKRRLSKRSKIPDTKEDDMYNRRLVREKPASVAEPQSAVSTVSYLMASPIQAAYDSEGEYKKDIKTTKEPDITFDDVAYRNLKHAQTTLKVTDSQPPFGIPLGPVAPSPNSDYLHATSQNVYLPLRKQTRIPDIVKDDLAFRNLRKDSNKDAVLPQSSLDLNYLKKRRAVRSLSANIGNILGKPQRNGDGDVENEFRSKTLTDIADAMEIARQVLQEKGRNISNTKKAFMSDTEVRPNTDAFRESRRKFLDGLKDADSQVSSRPPKGLTPERKLQKTPTKEAVPIVKPSVEDEKSTNSSLDDLLNALAEEAKVTTERITKELEELEKKRNEQETSELESCQKLLKAVVDDNHPTDETVQEINVAKPMTESAVLVQSCFESEHDYENIHSADDSIDVEQMEKEVRKEVEAQADEGFRELNKDVDSPRFDNDEDRPPRRHFRLRLNRLQRPISCPDEAMSENHRDSRATRIARYKEERRKQLAEQFGNVGEPATPKGGSSSSSDGPRPTRASHLRAQAATTQRGSASSTKTEKSVSPLSDTSRNKQERDKSSKRKSNLNRSLNSEEVPAFSLNEDPKAARRRRRFFPQEVLDQAPRSPSSRDISTASAISSVNTPSTARFTAPTSLTTSTTHATSDSPSKQSSKRSGISVHMENARRSVTSPSTPDTTHRYKPFVARTRTQVTAQRDRPTSSSTSVRGATSVRPSTSASDNETNRNIAKRMEELKAFTRETLAKVERLTNRTKDLHVKRPSPVKQMDPTPSSILKRKPREEKETAVVVVNEAPVPTHVGPVSILKRKVAQDEKTEAHSTPVTFSPNVVEPTTTNRKQGILKKRRSLDESSVMRHRSCSPDVANKSSDSKSILKSQRRSSLEELRRTQSPEVHIHGILKRKPRTDDDDQSLNSPQGILKRRSGASSAGSTTSTPHVSITTAVILAAAGGAEMILDPEASQEPVKPILKKKSSEEHSFSENSADAPKPILKKKSSTDTDDGEEKPMKPILKLPRNSVEREILDTGQDVRYSRFSSLESSDDVKPILKTTNLRAESPRPRLSFCGDTTPSPVEESRLRTSRRSYTICSDFNVTSNAIGRGKDDDRDLKKARPLSVLELIKTFEKNVNNEGGTGTGGGAIPKKRSGDRYRTQPVTSNELEASRNLITHSNQRHVPQSDDHSPRPSQLSYHAHNTFLGSSRSLDAASFDYTSPLENESRLSSFLSSSFQAVGVSPESPACHKTSSDSAFQSLGDGLELEEPPEESEEGANEMSLASQMRSLAEEAKQKRQEKDQIVIERRGILKASQSGETSTPLPKSGQSGPRSALRRRDSPPAETTRLDSASFESGRTESAFQRVKPSRTETCTDKDDEGISCNDSGSDSEPSEAKSQRQPKGRLLDDTTSEGESSGGREVRSIFKNENTRLNLNFKQQLEGVLAKSKSHSTFNRISPSCETNAGNFEEPACLDEDSTLGARKGATNLRRSHTHTAGAMPRSIADLRAKLQENGERGWMKRVALNNNSCDELKLLKDKNRYNDELSEKTFLASKKDQLDAASNQWKNRVEKSDAEKFSVAGKMEKIPTINISSTDKKKGPPQAKRFRGKNGAQDPSSTPSSPEKNTPFDLTRSKSALSPLTPRSDTESESKIQSRVVSVNRPDDFTFTTFFQSVEQVKADADQLDVKLEDFDAVERQSLLIYKKNVQIRHRREATKNPIKALATRTDITDEYTEVITGVAEREKKRLNIEKLAQNSNKALEALAGLASKEDFKAIALKKSQTVSTLVPWKSPMLLQVKGRRHVQTRLVEPTAASINEGDCYLLVTTSVVYNYVGAYANVIEQSRATDVANHIHKTNDLGCKAAKIVTVSAKDVSKKQLEAFWKILGSDSIPETVDAGHPEEDGTYESNILQTNMVYTIEDNELVPMDACWGTIPKINMLSETNVIVFDFGSEMYVWSGKNASPAKKNLAMKLAKELWEEGFDYSKCSVNPLNVAAALGERPSAELPLTGDARPPWAMFAKITQHRETVLFKEKFLDWPDFSRVIRVRSEDGLKRGKGSIEIKPCNVDEMTKDKGSQPDLEIGTVHLGRGDHYFDEETRRLFQYDTVEIKAWRIQENCHEQLDDASIGQFYDGDSYIYSWRFRQTVMGRELNGKPSKHAQVGRDVTAFFCWHGNKSSVNEKCTAAFLTVELDKQNAPQIRVVQGSEPAAFLRLFQGSMMIHKGKRNEVEGADASRLFIVRGEVPEEIYFMEVPLDMSSLRSRTSLVLLNPKEGQATIWHGSKATDAKRKVTKTCIQRILESKPPELFLGDGDDSLEVVEIEEGSESEDFLDTVGNDRTSYFSLLESDTEFNFSPRLFRMSSITGNFMATEVLCPHRSDNTTPYPFVQSELYQGSQPGLLLFDNQHELWLWQGWWPEKEDSEVNADQTGSGAVRWQAERRAAMQTALNYWRKKYVDQDEPRPVVAHLVWAGLEPLQFCNLFPAWEVREDVRDLNLKDGKKEKDKISLQVELAHLSRTTYPLADILQRPLPEGVDPTQLEIYLSDDDFKELLRMSKQEFEQLPAWRKTALKKEKGLF